MRLIKYLDALNWTQTRLAQEAKVSISTVSRLIQEKTISRQNADRICATLIRALNTEITIEDIDELHVPAAERPERRKAKPIDIVEQRGGQGTVAHPNRP